MHVHERIVNVICSVYTRTSLDNIEKIVNVINLQLITCCAVLYPENSRTF